MTDHSNWIDRNDAALRFAALAAIQRDGYAWDKVLLACSSGDPFARWLAGFNDRLKIDPDETFSVSLFLQIVAEEINAHVNWKAPEELAQCRRLGRWPTFGFRSVPVPAPRPDDSIPPNLHEHGFADAWANEPELVTLMCKVLTEDERALLLKRLHGPRQQFLCGAILGLQIALRLNLISVPMQCQVRFVSNVWQMFALGSEQLHTGLMDGTASRIASLLGLEKRALTLSPGELQSLSFAHCEWAAWELGSRKIPLALPDDAQAHHRSAWVRGGLWAIGQELKSRDVERDIARANDPTTPALEREALREVWCETKVGNTFAGRRIRDCTEIPYDEVVAAHARKRG